MLKKGKYEASLTFATREIDMESEADCEGDGVCLQRPSSPLILVYLTLFSFNYVQYFGVEKNYLSIHLLSI